jgi:hypothetical protein
LAGKSFIFRFEQTNKPKEITMNKLTLFAAALLMTVVANAKPVAPTNEQISPAQVDKTIRLSETDNQGITKKLSIVVTDHGKSTDVSPRYSVYLSYNSMAEMGNISGAYLITHKAYSDVSAKRIAPGLYEVKYTEYRDELGMVDVTATINAEEAFIEDKNKRANCGDDFCDGSLTVSIKVTESVATSK